MGAATHGRLTVKTEHVASIREVARRLVASPTSVAILGCHMMVAWAFSSVSDSVSANVDEPNHYCLQTCVGKLPSPPSPVSAFMN